MKIIDLFSGVGGLSLGFEEAGFETVVAIDLWEDAINTFNHNRKIKVGLNVDIHTFNNNQLNTILSNNKITGVIGGPPCQGFSSARLSDNSDEIGKINEARNQLYLQFFETVKKAQPEFFLIENVRGMVTSNKGAFVKDIFERFGKLGYEINFQILNAADYGVPQNRYRVFFVGLRNDLFKFTTPNFDLVTSLDALSDLPTNFSNTKLAYSSQPINQYQKKIRGNSRFVLNHEDTKHSLQTKEIIAMIPDGGNIKSLPKDYWKIRRFNKAFQRMNSKMPSLTIDTGHRNYFHYKENRIPTVREAARIQSFPDIFEFIGSKTSQYKQVGNAVPPKLAFELALEIRKYLNN